jgi:hypothetical protein
MVHPILKCLLVVPILLCPIVTAQSVKAGGDDSSTTPPPPSALPVGDSGITSNNNGTVGQQTNLNITPTYSSLGYPQNCDGVCTFAVSRLHTSYNGKPSWEGVVGIVSQFGSADQKRVKYDGVRAESEAKKNLAEAESSQATAKRYLAEAEETQARARKTDDESTLNLLTNLSDAIRSADKEKAKLISMHVYKRLGYANYTSFFQSLGVNW